MTLFGSWQISIAKEEGKKNTGSFNLTGPLLNYERLCSRLRFGISRITKKWSPKISLTSISASRVFRTTRFDRRQVAWALITSWWICSPSQYDSGAYDLQINCPWGARGRHTIYTHRELQFRTGKGGLMVEWRAWYLIFIIFVGCLSNNLCTSLPLAGLANNHDVKYCNTINSHLPFEFVFSVWWSLASYSLAKSEVAREGSPHFSIDWWDFRVVGGLSRHI